MPPPPLLDFALVSIAQQEVVYGRMRAIEEAKNIGPVKPVTGAELRSVGIDTIERLIELGWEDAFERLVAYYPERLNLNACVALLGAVEGTDRRRVPEGLKNEARALLKATAVSR